MDSRETNSIEMILRKLTQKGKESSQKMCVFYDLSLQERMFTSCEIIRQLQPNIGIIMYTFQANSKNKPLSGYERNNKQICVSNHSIISDIKEVII